MEQQFCKNPAYNPELFTNVARQLRSAEFSKDKRKLKRLANKHVSVISYRGEWLTIKRLNNKVEIGVSYPSNDEKLRYIAV